MPTLLAKAIPLVLVACSGGGGGGFGTARAGNAELIAVHHGRLVDVYGLRETAGLMLFSLYQTDVLVGSDIRDERATSDDYRDEDILYDFISPNPDTLQPRLFIPRDMETPEFRAAFARLDAGLRVLAPAQVGHSAADSGFSVVARDSAIRLTFSGDLDIDNEFFVERDDAGNIVGLRNNEAVQLLKIVGDPSDEFDTGDFEFLSARISLPLDGFGNVARRDQIIIDPVLLGREGVEIQSRNNASGMPEAPDQVGANVRIAIALEGPLAIPGIREDSVGDLTGKNNSGRLAVIRDLRAGNRLDDSSDIVGGFLRDPIPPRLVGNIPFLLERVEEFDEISLLVTVFKNGLSQEIDRGDLLRLADPANRAGILSATTEVIADPEDDRGRPGTQRVRVRVRRLPQVLDDQGKLVDPIEALDRSHDPDYPQDPGELDAWLARNAPRAILIAEFTASRTDPFTGQEVRDDPRNFITFSPDPIAEFDGSPSAPAENVSPFAGAIIRFTKPVDFATVKSADTFFLGTRDLLDPVEIRRFRLANGRGPGSREIDRSSFSVEKFRTPHLIAARLYDEDGSQTAVRLQPILGFYLADVMREDTERVFDDKKYKYFLHLVGGSSGIADLSGNPIDFQASSVADNEQIVIPFSLDTRMRNSVDPVFPENIVASVVRTYNVPDEDEQPSYYRSDEIQQAGLTVPVVKAQAIPDIFGAVTWLEGGTLQARPTGRIRQAVDNLNQPTPPPQRSDFRWCPDRITTFSFAKFELQVAASTAAIAFQQAGVQNPLNPFGSRLQTVWREIDMGLSRTDPFDFNLDVEQLYWAPFTGSPIHFDEFDRVSLFLGHSEMRPEPCVGATSSLPSMPNSGLQREFERNYAHNNDISGVKTESAPAPHPAYVDAAMQISPALAITEPNGIHRYLPLPTFNKPYFVWRDETVVEQGGNSSVGTDTDVNNVGFGWDYHDYISSPYLAGHGRKLIVASDGSLVPYRTTWTNSANHLLEGRGAETATGGLVGAIALPLLADFWSFCDSPSLPAGGGFLAQGVNGWQISLAVQSDFNPAFRAFSGGFAGYGARPDICIDQSSSAWERAAGGYDYQGNKLPIVADNTVYWIMADFLKRSTVATAGFVDITNPHRMPNGGSGDPRLGPYYGNALPTDVLPTFNHSFEPPLETLPGGTSVVVEFRGAGTVDPDPWRPRWDIDPQEFPRPAWNLPTPDNFPLDPLKAGDAHIRKFDNRSDEDNGKPARNWWTYLYNTTVTGYTEDLNTLMDLEFTNRYSEPRAGFTPQDVKYFNWRFLMTNNVDASPPVSPTIDTFMVTYRFEQAR